MSYTFNPQALSTVALVSGEAQSLTPVSASAKYNYVLPLNGPFFWDALVVSLSPSAVGLSNLALGTTVTLTPYVDYVPALNYMSASVACGQSVYGAISFIDPQLAGTLTLTYVPLGGAYTPSRADQLALIAAQALNPRVRYYEDAFPTLPAFPTVNLTYDTALNRRLATVSTALTALGTTLSSTTAPAAAINFANHIADYLNPHYTTATSAGLGNVPPWSLATSLQAQQATSNALFLTPFLAYQAMQTEPVNPYATTSSYGKVKLNIGSAAQAADTARVLTAAGLIALKTSASSNAVKALFSYERQVLSFSPRPIAYPVFCLGQRCRNFTDLVQAVQTYTSVSPIVANAAAGCIYLPYDVPTPDLTLTPAS